MKFWQKKFLWYCQCFQRKEKRSMITSLVTSFIGLPYEGISSYLQNRRQKAWHKAFVAMENKMNLEQNRVFYLEDSMVMYGIYNSDTLEQLVDTMHKMHNKTTWNEKLFASKLNFWYHLYLSKDGVCHYAINSLLFLTTMRKICQDVWEIYQSTANICLSDKNSFEGLFIYFSLATIKIELNFRHIQKGYSDYKSRLW